MADLTLEQQKALAMASARLRLQESAPETPAQPVMGLPDFQSTGGGAAVGNPMLKAKTSLPESDWPYEIGGSITDAVAKTGLPPEVSAGAGYLGNLALQAAPVVAGGSGGARLAPLVKARADRLMQSAIKPAAADVLSGKYDKAVSTLYDEKLMPTRNGVDEMKRLISGLNDQVSAKIAGSNATVDVPSISTPLLEKLDYFANANNPKASIKSILDAWDEFSQHSNIIKSATGGDKLTVQDAQKMKQISGRLLEDEYGSLSSAQREAQKALVRGEKDGISAAVPEVAPLNARESSLINAKNVVQRRAAIEDNNNIVGLGAAVHSPSALVAWMLDRWGGGKAALAHLLNANQRTIPTAIGAGAGASLSDLQRQ